MPFKPGELTAPEAAELNALAQTVQELTRLSVSAPLSMVNVGGAQKVISLLTSSFSGARVTNISGSQVIPNFTNTVLSFDAVRPSTPDFDTDGYVDAVNNKFVIPAAGYYAAGMWGDWNSNPVGFRQIGFSPNPSGTSNLEAYVTGPPVIDGAGSRHTAQSVYGMGFMPAGSVLYFFGMQGSGGNLTFNNVACFWIHRIG